MRFATAIASLLTVGMATAQAASCAAQYILDACLSSTTPQLKACAANDWTCLCDRSNTVLTCYNNCPGHDGQFGAQQTKTSYCNAAKAYASTTTTSQAAIATANDAASASSASEAASSPSTTSSSAQSTSSGAAAAVTGAVHNIQGGVVAALALGLGAVL
ncbi:GPI anchored serine-threonine rich protein [Talaromyces islandicus]|uniref:GPI anchored serine-threonine rich protein n=1 Tax=Talaromyces islandicus TaxID=28573 RepID=A0A0U1LRV2_TALIS|nr:GPI anchored serine-threonine rich protein [Talaromyces islandicus]